MIQIAICDDEQDELNKTKEKCRKYMEAHEELGLRIRTFTSSKELICCFNEEGPFDLLLLDIYMPDMSGMELARFLREKQVECEIVFLTSSLAHAVEAFSLHAAHYLVKPFSQDQMNDALNQAVISLEKHRGTQVMLKTSGGIRKVNIFDFIYSETEKHVQHIHLSDSKYFSARISCSELFDLLSFDVRFFKCGSTYLINLAKIEEITSRYILFDNGEKIPMQRRQYRELLDRFTRYTLEDNE